MEQYKRLFRSFVYAFRGIKHCITTERNLRIHITFMIYMFSILLSTDWFVLSRTDYAILAVTCGAVIAAEILNSAIENAVNLAKEEKTEYGRIAKDSAAGAVLILAIFSVIVGLILLLQPEAFKAMYNYFKENIHMLAVFLLSSIPATIFIFWGNPFSKGKKDE